MNPAAKLPVLRNALAVLAEAVRMCRAQPLATGLTVFIVAGMCASVVMTSGRTEGTRAQLQQTLETQESRSIVIRLPVDSGVTAEAIERTRALRGLEWAAGFGAAYDVRNARIPGGTRVTARTLFVATPQTARRGDVGVIGMAERRSRVGWATPVALERLGLTAGGGVVVDDSKIEYSIAGELPTDLPIQQLGPTVLFPKSLSDDAPLTTVIVVVRETRQVRAMTDAVVSLLGAKDPSKLQIVRNENLASYQASIDAQVGSFAKVMTLSIFVGAAVLQAVIFSFLVLIRRRDFGRRRALGASRGLVISLIALQITVASAVGTMLGLTSAAIGLRAGGDPLPTPAFFAAVGILSVVVGLTAAITPGIIAARRDPARELRVP